MTRPKSALAIASLLLSAPIAGAAQLHAVRAAGGQSSAWLIVTYEPVDATAERTSRLMYRTASSGQLRYHAGGEAILGPIRDAAVLEDRLHVLFAGGSHMEYSPAGQAVRAVLPGQAPPLLLCADEPDSSLWALASQTSPATTSATAPATQDHQPQQLVLLRYRSGRWDHVAIAPAAIGSATRRWMCADNGVVHLFWLEGDPPSPIWHATWNAGRWTQPDQTHLSHNGACLAAMVVNRQVLLLLNSPADRSGSTCTLRLARLSEKGWVTGPEIQAHARPLQVDPAHTFAAPLAQNILLGTWSPEGAVQLGLLDPATATVELTELPVEELTPSIPALPATPPWLVTVLMGGIMLLIFWRRQPALLRPAPLPSHLACAPVWRRLVAFLIDAVPAGAITAPLWLALLVQVTTAGPPEQLDPATQADLAGRGWTAWLALRGFQAAYCALTEVVLGASPGKLLLGCRVVAEDGRPAAVGRVILRNLLRVLELEINPPLLPLLLLVILTRNRQRLGDIVARTIVVQQRSIGQARPAR